VTHINTQTADSIHDECRPCH